MSNAQKHNGQNFEHNRPGPTASYTLHTCPIAQGVLRSAQCVFLVYINNCGIHPTYSTTYMLLAIQKLKFEINLNFKFEKWISHYYTKTMNKE